MLITVQEVFPYLTGEISPSFSTKDLTLLKDLINQATGIISGIVGYNIEEHEKSEILDGNGSNILYLNGYPTSLISIKISNIGDFDNGELIDITDCIIDQTKFAIIYKNGKFPQGKNNILVNYICGWNNNTLPSDLKSILVFLTSQLFDKIRKNQTDVTYQAGLGSSVTFTSEKYLTSHHYRILDKYRVPI